MKPLIHIQMLACGVTLLFAASGMAASPRQYHTKWKASPDNTYYYCSYVYKQNACDCSYKKQYCVASPKYPGCCFYYNPTAGKYWGLCFEGQTPDKMFVNISSVSFPTPEEIDELKTEAGPMPAIPGSTDGVAMQIPPGTLR